MSKLYYDLRWKEAINELQENIQIENLPLEKNEGGLGIGHKYTEYEIFLQYANLYVKYIDCYKKLEDCYDQLVHPQKRTLLKEMLENTMVRIIELKNDLIKHNTHHDQVQSDFINLDELLMDLKLLPNNIEFPLPSYFKEDDPNKAREERNQAIDKLMVQFRETSLPEEEVLEDKFVLEANLETAIRIIQKNERGRQGIETALKYKYRKKEELKRKKQLQQNSENSEDNTREEAIQVVQKYYRGYKSREFVDKLRQAEFEFLGMKKTTDDPVQKEEIKLFLKTKEEMKIIKGENEKEFQDELKRQKELIKKNEGPDIKEDMLQKRREWIERYRDMNDFQKLPVGVEEFYDSKDVMMPLTPEQQEAKRIEEEQKAKEEKKKKEQRKAGKGKPTKKTDLEEFLESRGKTGPTETVYKIQENIEKYEKEWAKKDFMKNFTQKHEVDYAKEKVRPEVEEEIKKVVDEMITIYLDNLRTGKVKGGKKKNPKAPRQKPLKLPGLAAVSKKDPRDLLGEFVEVGIVKKLMPARVDDLLGEPDNLGCIYERQMKRMPDPSYSQLRQNLKELIGIPLGSPFVRQKLDTKNKVSFLFYGPAGTGKTMMVRALANECDAIVLDISPSNTEGGQYMDKESTKRMIAMTFVVAKTYQPAIIYIDECELVHPGGKKKKAGGGANASRIKKLLNDYKNKFLVPKEDRVVIIGCTNKPYDMNMKEAKAFYDKKFYFPFPNYGTRKLLFKALIEQKGVTLPDNFSLSTVAHISEGYSAGSFKMAIDKVITERRKIQLKERPLSFQEFLVPLSLSFFTSSDIFNKYIAFTEDATGLKERRDKKNNPQTEEDPKKKKKK